MKKIKNKYLAIILIIGMLLNLQSIIFTKVFASDETVSIELSDSSIMVDGENISTDSSKNVYKTTAIETNPDIESSLSNTENTIINITKAGTYKFTGTITNAQIAVNASDSDKVNIILSNANITCKTAPAITVYNAKENKTAGEAGVNINLADGTTNNITGSHIPEDSTQTINGTQTTYSAKYDAAISSDVSISFDGTGKLIVNSDNEGIETKMHLTINNGDISITSQDDALNASEDNVSVVTINDGTIYCNIEGEEGDGIDSNGYMYINGGNIYAFASANSQDSGLDSDLGIYINGGNVIATGNMTDEVSEKSEQTFMFLQFANQQKADTLVCITDTNGNAITAFKSTKTFTTLLYSSKNFVKGTYNVYAGGNIEGTENNGLYTDINSYEKGTKQQYSDGNNSAKTEFSVTSSNYKFNSVSNEGSVITQSDSNFGPGERNIETNETGSTEVLGIVFLVIGIVVLITFVGVIVVKGNKKKKIENNNDKK